MPVVRAGAAKWKQRAAAAQGDYAAGVRAPRRSWAQATQAAAQAYAQGVQQAIADGRFARGVQAAGDQKWQAQASGIGAQRFASGVQQSGNAYEQGFAPYRQVIEAITLPDRGPKGDPGNYQRSVIIGQALHQKKIESSRG